MPSSAISGLTRPRFNFTEISTARLLIAAGATCALLWMVIATTVIS